MTFNSLTTTPSVKDPMLAFDQSLETRLSWVTQETTTSNFFFAPTESKWNKVADLTVSGELNLLISHLTDDSATIDAMEKAAFDESNVVSFMYDPVHM